MASYPPSPFPVDYAADPCDGCSVKPGQPHDDLCDVARCLFTGGQRKSCSGDAHEDCGRDTWTGRYPGDIECEEFGWFAVCVPRPAGEKGFQWVPCDRDAPGATQNLNRLRAEARWDRDQGRWVR